MVNITISDLEKSRYSFLNILKPHSVHSRNLGKFCSVFCVVDSRSSRGDGGWGDEHILPSHLSAMDLLRKFSFISKKDDRSQSMDVTRVKSLPLKNNGGLRLKVEGDACPTQLVWAARSGEGAMVRSLLKHGSSVEEADKEGNTALMEAAASGHTDIVAMLAKAGASVSATNLAGETAMHHAALMGRTKVVALLLSLGGEVGAATTRGTTPIHKAANKGHVNTFRALVEAGADINCQTRDGLTPLHLASAANRNPIVIALIQLGAESCRVRTFNCPVISLSQKNANQKTALMVARENGHPEVVLLLTGVHNMQRTKEGQAKLREARSKGEEEVVRVINSATKPFRERIMDSVSTPDLTTLRDPLPAQIR